MTPPSNNKNTKLNKRLQRMVDVVQDMSCLFTGEARTTIVDTSLYDNICYQPPTCNEIFQRI